MKIQLITEIYNDKRFGKPWIAKVSIKNGTVKYEFGSWVGEYGYRGLLILGDVEVGDVIARGQKGTRGSNILKFLKVTDENQSLEILSKVDAYKILSNTKIGG